MSGLMSSNPCVAVKPKNMQEVLEYCMEQRMAIRALPRGTGDEWELEFFPENHLQAVALGMFLREHKLELVGFGTPSSAPNPKSKPKRPEKKVEQMLEPQAKNAAIDNATNPTKNEERESAGSPSFALPLSEEPFQIDPTPTLDVKSAGFGLFEGDNEEAPFS